MVLEWNEEVALRHAQDVPDLEDGVEVQERGLRGTVVAVLQDADPVLRPQITAGLVKENVVESLELLLAETVNDVGENPRDGAVRRGRLHHMFEGSVSKTRIVGTQLVLGRDASL